MEVVSTATGRTVGQRRRDPDHIGELEEVAGDQVGSPLPRLKCPQSPLQQQKQSDRGLVLLGHCVGSLDHRPRGHHRFEVGTEVRERLDDVHLGDGVQVSAFVEDQIDMCERFEPTTETTLGLPDAFRHGPDFPPISTKENHHPIGLPKRVGTEDYALVMSDRHEDPEGSGGCPPALCSVLRTLTYCVVMTLLSTEEIDQFLDQHPGWELSDKSLVRTFTHKDFAEAMAFVNEVADLAEEADHHPDIDIRWNKVRLELSTHSEGGLTGKDETLASAIESLVA